MTFDGFELPEELNMLRDGLRRFVREEIVPVTQALPADTGVIPRSEVAKLQEKAKSAGYWMLDVPEKYGGLGLPAFWRVVLMEEMAKHKFSIAGTDGPNIFGPSAPMALLEGSDYLRENYGLPVLEKGLHYFSAVSEPSGGSDPARAIRTTAVRDGDTYVLNGRKLWATYADAADFGIVYARTDKSKNRDGISAFVVDVGTPGMTITTVPVIRDQPSTEIVFEDCVIPAANRIGSEGEGFQRAQQWFLRGRLKFAAICTGVADEALRMTIDWVRQRETFGALLATRQAIQFAIADAAVEIRAARWLTWDAAWKVDQGQDARYEASIAKLYATEMAYRVVDMAMQYHGGMGMSRELPLERWLRGIRIWRIGEGASEIHRFVIARELIGPAVFGQQS